MIWVTAAWAQDVISGGDLPELNAQNFRPSVDAPRALWVDEAARAPEGPVGRLLFHYTDDPLVYRTEESTVGLVRNVVQADLIGVFAGQRSHPLLDWRGGVIRHRHGHLQAGLQSVPGQGIAGVALGGDRQRPDLQMPGHRHHHRHPAVLEAARGVGAPARMGLALVLDPQLPSCLLGKRVRIDPFGRVAFAAGNDGCGINRIVNIQAEQGTKAPQVWSARLVPALIG